MKRNQLPLIALLLGIASIINLFGLEKGIMAVIAGWLALRELKAEPESGGKGMAWAGVILGAASIVFVIVVLIWKGPDLMHYLKSLPRTGK